MTQHWLTIPQGDGCRRLSGNQPLSGHRTGAKLCGKSTKRTNMAEKIGFVGVGRMGSNMARRLKETGYEIGAVYDVNTSAAQAVAQELGGQAAETLQQVT